MTQKYERSPFTLLTAFSVLTPELNPLSGDALPLARQISFPVLTKRALI